jgi:hypothetical protein
MLASSETSLTLDDPNVSTGVFENIHAAPGIEGVVHFELPLQVFEIVGKPQPIAHGNGLKPRCQWILIQPIGVRRVDHFGHAQQSRVGEAKFPNDDIEGVSKAIAPSFAALSNTWALDAKTNSASESMNLPINQGQATRSTCTWDRVIHFIVNVLPLIHQEYCLSISVR